MKELEFRLNTETHDVTGPSGTEHLTPKEFELLKFFMDHSDEILTKELILAEVWPEYEGFDSHRLEICVGNLRKKIGENSSSRYQICTIFGVGYRFGLPQSWNRQEKKSPKRVEHRALINDDKWVFYIFLCSSILSGFFSVWQPVPKPL